MKVQSLRTALFVQGKLTATKYILPISEYVLEHFFNDNIFHIIQQIKVSMALSYLHQGSFQTTLTASALIEHRIITTQIEHYMSFFQDLGDFRSQEPWGRSLNVSRHCSLSVLSFNAASSVLSVL